MASLVGAVALALAATGVFGWLPARASDEVSAPKPGGPSEAEVPSAATDAISVGAPVLPPDRVPAAESERH